MITFETLRLVLRVLGWALQSIPVPSPPAWLSSPDGALMTVFGGVYSMSVWFPTGLVMIVVGAAFLARLAGLGIKVARMVLSLFTGGGGNVGGS